MLYPLAGLLIGAIVGGARAKARGGKRADIAQWAIAHGLALGLVGVFVMVIIARIAVN